MNLHNVSVCSSSVARILGMAICAGHAPSGCDKKWRLCIVPDHIFRTQSAVVTLSLVDNGATKGVMSKV